LDKILMGAVFSRAYLALSAEDLNLGIKSVKVHFSAYRAPAPPWSPLGAQRQATPAWVARYPFSVFLPSCCFADLLPFFAPELHVRPFELRLAR
jgi:hypothetical protein